MRVEEENQTEIFEESMNKSWSSNARKTKEPDSQDIVGVTRRTEPMVNYQKEQNITVKDHIRNNVTHQIDNTIMIYNETTKEVYIDKEEGINPESCNNNNSDKPDIHLVKPKQKIHRKDEGEQELRKT